MLIQKKMEPLLNPELLGPPSIKKSCSAVYLQEHAQGQTEDNRWSKNVEWIPCLKFHDIYSYMTILKVFTDKKNI